MSGHWNTMSENVMYNEAQVLKPDYQAAFGLLSHLNLDELREVLNNDSKFEHMIKDVKELKDIETEKELVMASNRSLAEFNLLRKPRLEGGKIMLQKLTEEGESLCQSVDSKQSNISHYSGGQKLETTLALLQTAAAEMEEESEDIAKKFLEGEIDVEAYLEQFSGPRTLMHLRRVKADKMAEMVNRRSTQISNDTPLLSMNRGYGAGYYQPPLPSAAVPYPIGHINNMPMPGLYPSVNHF